MALLLTCYDYNRRVREAALAALAGLGAAEAVAAGLDDLLPRIRGRTITLLAELHAGDALAVALEDSDPALRLAATHALVRLEAPRRLLPALTDADATVRGAAAEGVLALTLGGVVACGGTGLVGMLMGAMRPLLADPQRQLRHTAARVLAAHDEAEWLAVFDEPDGPPCAAALAASTLGTLVMEVLVGLLTVPQPEDRKVAASMLGLRMQPFVPEAAALRGRACNPMWYQVAASTLGLRLDSGAAAALRVAARDPHPEVLAPSLYSPRHALCSS